MELQNWVLVVAQVTPLIRAQKLIKESADNVGIDAGRGYDRHQTYLSFDVGKAYLVQKHAT